MRTSRSGSIPLIAFVAISATIAVACGDDDDSGDESAATETSTPAPAGTGSVAPETTSGSVTTESTAATTESTEPTVTTEPTEVACSEDESTPPATQQLGEAEQLDGGSTFQETVTSLTIKCPMPFVANDGSMGDPERCIYESERINVITEDTLEEADDLLDRLVAALPATAGPVEQLESEPVLVSDNGDNQNYLYRFAIGPGVDPVALSAALPPIGGVVKFFPNYLITLTPGWILGPGSFEIPGAAVGNGPNSPTNGEVSSVTIGVVDSGATVPDLEAAGVDLATEHASMNLVGSGQDLGTGFVEQHGTYLSVMLARLLPDVTIHMENAPFDVNSNVRSWELASGESTIVADDYSLAAALTTRFSAIRSMCSTSRSAPTAAQPTRQMTRTRRPKTSVRHRPHATRSCGST